MQCLAKVCPLLRDGEPTVGLVLVPAGPQLTDVGRGGLADALSGKGVLGLVGPQLLDAVLQWLDGAEESWGARRDLNLQPKVTVRTARAAW